MNLDIAVALAADLHDLVAGLDIDEFELVDASSMMRRDLRLAVRSALGFSFSVHYDQLLPVTVTVVDRPLGPDEVKSSLRVSPPTRPGQFPVTVVFYAARAGVFVDLAADLTYALGLPLDAAVLDEVVTQALTTSVTGVAELSTVRVATGLLMGRGLSHAQAQIRLHTRAVADGTDLVTAAQLLLDAG